ncbi:MAG TPA: nitroreductase family deazaflavin-dependent oxidoreductase [Anaerolineae bacterium]|nr:nitroreductase family deazaflavin-dependent oxidoreductase [Anaerolineae bacterium]
MVGFERLKKYLWRLMRFPPRVAYAIGLGPLIGRFVLLLTTTGRKSGLPRVTPLQYEEIEEVIYIGSARGDKADWYRNILANPKVEVRVKSHRFVGSAEAVADVERVADFLEIRLARNPRMIGVLFRFTGLPVKPDRIQLEQYAAKRAMVMIHPQENSL